MRSELQLLTVMFAGVCMFVVAALVYHPFGLWCTFEALRILHICVTGADVTIPPDLICRR